MAFYAAFYQVVYANILFISGFLHFIVF